jgi:prepilin-type N-terminal cleavage/methylation domain-containing protein/prepilin-type processing-associated H-X9-DG protein
MKRNTLAQTKRAAFTLIELLIVMAIVAVLASLLLPTLARAKGAALNGQCQARLKQWGVALNLYLNDFQRYPLAGAFDATGQVRLAEELIGAYFGGPDSAERVFNMRCRVKWPAEGLRYYYNDFARTVSFPSYLSLGGDFAAQIAVPETAVKVPSDMIAFTEDVAFRDASVPVIPGQAYSGLVIDYPRTGKEDFYPHRNAVNQVFCDGHVERVTKKEFASKLERIRRRWFIDNKPHPELWF